MGYHVSIVRTRGSERIPITEEEVISAIGESSEFKVGKGVRGEAIVEILSAGDPPPCLWYSDGELWTKNPDEATVDGMCELANLLGARVRGDELETYRSSSDFYHHPDDSNERAVAENVRAEWVRKSKRRSLIVRVVIPGLLFAIGLVLGTCSREKQAMSMSLPEANAEDGADPPEAWGWAFRSQHQEVWDRLRKDDGKVTADEVIEENYKGGSHHDGDRQLATALSLIQLADDPIPHLRKMMTEEKPERRAFAVLVAGMLGDSRLQPEIDRLEKDDAKLGQFPGDWFWDTVGGAAEEASKEWGTGGVAARLLANGGKTAAWLRLAAKGERAPTPDGDKPAN